MGLHSLIIRESHGIEMDNEIGSESLIGKVLIQGDEELGNGSSQRGM